MHCPFTQLNTCNCTKMCIVELLLIRVVNADSYSFELRVCDAI